MLLVANVDSTDVGKSSVSMKLVKHQSAPESCRTGLLAGLRDQVQVKSEEVRQCQMGRNHTHSEHAGACHCRTESRKR